MIEATARLRRAAWFAGNLNDAELERIENAKHLGYVMGEFSGRERANIGRAITQGEALSSQLLLMLGNFRGRVESAHGMLATFVERESVPVGVRDAFRTVEEAFFRRFQETRQAVYQAGMQGQAYPGPSPRGRGHHDPNAGPMPQRRTIPAWAGAPGG